MFAKGFNKHALRFRSQVFFFYLPLQKWSSQTIENLIQIDAFCHPSLDLVLLFTRMPESLFGNRLMRFFSPPLSRLVMNSCPRLQRSPVVKVAQFPQLISRVTCSKSPNLFIMILQNICLCNGLAYGSKPKCCVR